MKKRLVKKWIKRYLTPLIQDYPRTDGRYILIDQESREVIGTNHTIVNGYVKPEGLKPQQSTGMRKDILRTREALLNIINTHKHIFVRIEPALLHKRLYVRIITE